MNRFNFILILCFLFGSKMAMAQPCQTITPLINGNTNVSAHLEACQGETMNFTGSSSFSSSGAGATYLWAFGDGNNFPGVNSNHAYANGGIFTVTLLVTDPAGCEGMASIDVYIPKDPIFAGTHIDIDTVCPGNPVNLIGVAEPVLVKKLCAPPIADTTSLPDISGTPVPYVSSIEVACFNPGQAVTNLNDIVSLCMNIEHSYIGDLDAKLICPNGQQTVLFNTYTGAGGTEFLGIPVDQFPANGPIDNEYCSGSTYCFTTSATWGSFVTMITNTTPVTCTASNATVTTGNSMIAGNYQPEGSYASLIGCPLNGTWTLQITDNIGSDNGHIFNWGLEFDPAIIPGNDSFTPTITTAKWLNDATITSYNGYNAVAYPVDEGIKCYTFQVTDDFDCSYDTTVCLYVRDRPISEFYGEICPGGMFMGHPFPGIYIDTLSAVSGCDSIVVVEVVANPMPDVTLKGSANVEICEGSSTILALKNPESTSTFQWFNGTTPMAGETGPQVTVTQAGNYSVQATTNKGCQMTSEAFRLTVNPNPIAEIEPLSGDIICAFDTLTVKGVAGAGYDFRWSPEKPFRLLTGAEGQEVKGVFLEPITPIVLTVYNQFGCYDTATAIVNTKPCCEVFMPNAFSPNGDGSNDFFKPLLQQGQILLTMQVFDRWGKLVYNSSSPKLGWDGKYDNAAEAPSDTYMYFIKYTCSDGKLYEKKESVTLIR